MITFTTKYPLLSTQSVAVFRMFLTINNEFFHEKHSLVGFVMVKKCVVVGWEVNYNILVILNSLLTSLPNIFLALKPLYQKDE
jgi:hypothetical protein